MPPPYGSTVMRSIYPILILSLIVACGGDGKTNADIVTDTGANLPDSDPPIDTNTSDGGDSLDSSEGDEGTTLPPEIAVTVFVLLDDVPTEDITVMQGGNPTRWATDAEGKVITQVDTSVPGDLFLMAIHPDARVLGDFVYPNTTELTISLVSFDTSDNPDYIFKDPGVPWESHVIEKCAHCHLTIADTWYDTAHRTSAKNPILHDIYSGTAKAFDTESLCLERGGSWVEGKEPGTGAAIMHCQVSTTVTGLTAISSPGSNGNCADCHAPGIDGEIGQRDLLDAEGYGYEYGVHCEVCHHVESVDLAGGPGVSGSLKILRPSEPAPYPGMGEFFPLTFCPDEDVPNLYMGCVPRGHFRESVFCAGCHELNQPSFVPEAPVDEARWPDGKIPVHTTYTEWGGSSVAEFMSCQACHMPSADAEVTNTADLQFFGEANTGVTGGWPRPPGNVRLHTWSGPRSLEAYKLASPLNIAIEKSSDDDQISAAVTVSNSGAGHAMPTGEPLRSLILWVEAFCGTDKLQAVAGDAIPDFGGSVASKSSDEDWSLWPKATSGMIVTVVSATGEFHDYEGYGPFGDGTFSAAEKGMPIEHVVGSVTVVSVSSEGLVTFDQALPEGDKAYLLRSLPTDEGAVPMTLAGHSGFAFARVLTAPSGLRMVPHFVANDVASDNRIGPQKNWTSNHVFQATCDEPTISATLINRAYPYWLAQERGWDMRDAIIANTTE